MSKNERAETEQGRELISGSRQPSTLVLAVFSTGLTARLQYEAVTPAVLSYQSPGEVPRHPRLSMPKHLLGSSPWHSAGAASKQTVSFHSATNLTAHH